MPIYFVVDCFYFINDEFFFEQNQATNVNNCTYEYRYCHC